jgi:hypothetical protein
MNPTKTYAFNDDSATAAEPIRHENSPGERSELPTGEPARWSFFICSLPLNYPSL